MVLDIACGTGTILRRAGPQIAHGCGAEGDARNQPLSWSSAAGSISFIEADLIDINYATFAAHCGNTAAFLSHKLERIKDVPSFLKRS